MSDLSKMRNAFEPKPLVETYRGIVRRINASDHHVLSQRKRTWKQSFD
jgi:hypothetical protein